MNPTANDSPAVSNPSRRRRLRMLLLGVVPAVAALVAGALYLTGGRYVETDNAYVKAEKVPVGMDVGGSVSQVMVVENQAVAAGQPLFRLDSAPFEVAVAKAEAKLAQARTDLGALQASYREKEAEIALARTRYAFARKEQQRQADLVAKQFVSAARYDDAKQNTDLAAQQVGALKQDLDRIAESLGGGPNVPLAQQAAWREAEAELAQAKLDLARSVVYAPSAGVVGKPPKVGQYLGAGSTAMALVVSGNHWVEANFIETDLTYVHPGQPVDVRIDTYPNAKWTGRVESLSPATGSEFSVIPAQNATGNWVKVVQRVPVRIHLDSGASLPELRAGLSAQVEIDTGHRRRLLGLTL